MAYRADNQFDTIRSPTTSLPWLCTGVGSIRSECSIVSVNLGPYTCFCLIAIVSDKRSLVGSIGTGAMVRHPEGWRYIFYTLIGVYGLVIIGFGFLYNPPPPPDLVKRSFGELMHAIDLVGAALAGAGFALTILGLVWGGGEFNTGPASSGSSRDQSSLAPCCTGISLLNLFLLYRRLRMD